MIMNEYAYLEHRHKNRRSDSDFVCKYKENCEDLNPLISDKTTTTILVKSVTKICILRFVFESGSHILLDTEMVHNTERPMILIIMGEMIKTKASTKFTDSLNLNTCKIRREQPIITDRLSKKDYSCGRS